MIRRDFLQQAIGIGMLNITRPVFRVGQKVKCYGKSGVIERVDTEKEKIFTNALIHAAMFGLDVIKEPFYLVRFDKPERECELFQGFGPDIYTDKVRKLDRKFDRILAPQKAIDHKE